MPVCSLPECDRRVYGRGWCRFHYMQWYRTARPEDRRRPAIEDRFWTKVDRRGPDECWPWTAQRVGGYGQIHFDGKMRKAHRISYELAKGPIPDGLFVMHSCDNPPCVNPSHLSLGTHTDNMTDGRTKGRWPFVTHCKHGHALEGDNLYITPDGRRQCRLCRCRAQADFHRRSKETLPCR